MTGAGARPETPPWPVGVALFALEVAVFCGFIVWGWRTGGGGIGGVALAVAAPVALGAVWGTFAVPDDPHRNPHPPVPIPGPLRFAIELGIFGLAAWAIWSSGLRAYAETLLTGVVILYALTWERQRWLLRQ